MNQRMTSKTTKLIAGLVAVVLAGCGGYVYTTVGGTVTGLTTKRTDFENRHELHL